MHRHELHGIAGRIIFQAQSSTGLLKIIQVLQKFRQAPRLAFRFPLLYELPELVDVLAVLRGGALRHFQPLDEIAKDFAGRAPP